MYASLCLVENSKHSGELIGVHQKLDRTARWLLAKNLSATHGFFPTTKQILHFEGTRGPDGLKNKSPGKDEPEHFIQPDHDDGKLIGYVLDHRHNLIQALKNHNEERAAFEAAWMAHAITDGLTPAHHYPFRKVVDELMTDKDYKRLFGKEVKGIMRGNSMAQAARNNWLYWGAGGVMTKHIAFEYGVAYAIAPIPYKKMAPKDFTRDSLSAPDAKTAFYDSLEKIAKLKMYDRFLKKGWSTQLIIETREILIPEIVRAITLAWADSIISATEKEKA